MITNKDYCEVLQMILKLAVKYHLSQHIHTTH